MEYNKKEKLTWAVIFLGPLIVILLMFLFMSSKY